MLQAAEPKLNVQKPAGASLASGLASGPGAIEQATLGATMVVKGELSGSQALYIDGRVEGSISFPNHRVTIGRGAVVLANIVAREVVISGTVTGNIDCSERLEIRSEGVFTGELVTRRISIDEGAMVKGRVEVCKLGKTDSTGREVKAEAPSKPVAAVAPQVPAEQPKAAEADAGASRSAFRVTGSSVLYEEHKAGSR